MAAFLSEEHKTHIRSQRGQLPWFDDLSLAPIIEVVGNRLQITSRNQLFLTFRTEELAKLFFRKAQVSPLADLGALSVNKKKFQLFPKPDKSINEIIRKLKDLYIADGQILKASEIDSMLQKKYLRQ